MSQGPSAISRLWLRWKSIRLPWRKQWLVGSDLAGNTYWEFKDTINSNRFRRMVKYRSQIHYGDVQIPAQWVQWLRHTRPEAPSLQEQEYDLIRQSHIKELAAKADERWNSMPSLSDPPSLGKLEPAMMPNVNGAELPQTEPENKEGVTNLVGSQQEVIDNVQGKREDKGRFKGETREPKNKGNAPRGNPGEDWQPKSWTPTAARKR